ncbi:MAG: hypothetical protein J6U54_05350 [Clostridiales bacterium]|nr:hypothetical protein [Clostridiales bacterium]
MKTYKIFGKKRYVLTKKEYNNIKTFIGFIKYDAENAASILDNTKSNSLDVMICLDSIKVSSDIINIILSERLT